jgi:hypothetical protein
VLKRCPVNRGRKEIALNWQSKVTLAKRVWDGWDGGESHPRVKIVTWRQDNQYGGAHAAVLVDKDRVLVVHTTRSCSTRNGWGPWETSVEVCQEPGEADRAAKLAARLVRREAHEDYVRRLDAVAARLTAGVDMPVWTDGQCGGSFADADGSVSAVGALRRAGMMTGRNPVAVKAQLEKLGYSFDPLHPGSYELTTGTPPCAVAARRIRRGMCPVAADLAACGEEAGPAYLRRLDAVAARGEDW